MDDRLIFDFGLHKGFDSEFYLQKGFRVVALEAVPTLADAAKARLAPFGDRITIINKALFERPGETVSFYTVPDKDDWGSLFKNSAEKGVQTSVEIKVETIDLASIFDQFGVPYFLKCDMEGGDHIFLAQLEKDSRRPRYVSVEITTGTEPKRLAACGYTRGQIINQSQNYRRSAPEPAREGDFFPVKFHGEMSGLFGRELNENRWLPIDEAAELILMWKELQRRCPELALGWVDIHAC